MSKFYGLVFTFLALLLCATPAQAGKLIFWRFEPNQNRLTFTTDERVQPTAQLVPNPTRVVIDLPNTRFDRPALEQPVGGSVRAIRIGKPDPYTTRLVIEMAPGYTVDPQQVKVKGLSSTQWRVDLPTPQRTSESADPSLWPTSSPNNPRYPAPPSPQSNLPTSTGLVNESLQITPNGIVVRLDRTGDSNGININRNNNGQTINVDLPGATFPKSLAGQTFAINQYGVGSIQFVTESGNPRINLTVNPNSPNWQASYTRLGGVILLPRGGMRAIEGLTSPPGTGNTLSSSGNNIIVTNNSPGFLNRGNGPTIRALDLTRDNRQLVIQADRPLQARSGLNRLTGDYEIRIDNAQLAANLKGPEMGRNSPISQLKIRQENSNTVVISIQPSVGTRFGNLITGGDGRVALEIMPGVSTSGSYPPRYSNNPRPSYPSNPYPRNEANTGIPLQVDLAPQGSLPPIGNYPPPSNSFPNSSFPRPQRGQRLVFLDAGHGGKDPGAIGLNGIQEKDIILPISQYVGRYLEKQGIRVMQARDSDYFVSLQGRTDMANRAGADLFVSIHANSMGAGRPDISGLEVYYFGDRRLSDTIHRNILRTVNVKDRGVRKARFYVLRNSRMPSTLVEVGFVTGYDDAAKLTDVNYQQQMAQAIARGIVEYLQQN